MSLIEFINTSDYIDEKYYPKPAQQSLPEWYKKIPSFSRDQAGLGDLDREVLGYESGVFGPPTMKKCMPLFDSISAGYLIFTHMDIVVYEKEGESHPWYRWPGHDEPIAFHEFFQIEGFPVSEKEYGRPVPKYKNPWSVKTKPGYSCLFIPPTNRDNKIEILSGVVDTDNYNIPVQFPFRLVDHSWRGLIPAGTPIAQVIPFKRDSFKHKITGDPARGKEIIENSKKIMGSTFYNTYKNNFWFKKQYK